MPDAMGERLGEQPLVPAPPGGRRLVLAACLIATFMAAVESSIVATVIPTIVSDLGGFGLFTWVFTIYLLTQAVTIPVYGRLADLFGRKPVFYAGIAIFLLGTVLCGLAWSMPALIAFRALQGIGAGAIQPTASTILGDIYTPAERGRVQGLVSSVFGMSAVLGPSLGGFLVQTLSWRAVFWINVPIGLVTVAMIAACLKESVHRRSHRIDWAGSLLLAVGVGALMLALVQGRDMAAPWLAGVTLTGALALVALVFNERAVPEPMLALELWRNKAVVVGCLGNFTAGAMMMGIAAFLPTYVQGAMGQPAVTGGLVLGAMSVTWALFSLIAGMLMPRSDHRLIAVAGGAALVAGCTMLAMLTPADGPWRATAGSLVVGIGMGFTTTVMIVSIQASVRWGQRGAATSSAMFMRFIGQSLGASGCGAMLNATMVRLDPTAADAVNRLLDTRARAAMPAPELAHLVTVMGASLANAYWLATGFAGLTLLFLCWTPGRVQAVRE